MAAKQLYIIEELEWLEDRLREIKADIDSKPYAHITDRIVPLEGARGTSETIAATEESQKKAQRDALREYTSLLEATNKLREQEEVKMQTRGGANVNSKMKRLVKGD